MLFVTFEEVKQQAATFLVNQPLVLGLKFPTKLDGLTVLIFIG